MRRLLALSILALGCFGVLACAGPSDDRPISLALVDVVLLDPVSGPSPASVVLIGDGRIIEVGPALEVPDGVPMVDGAGLFLIPGLWDLHTHVSLLSDGALPLLVTQGVTGVRDLGGVLEDLDSLEQRIGAWELTGPRLVHVGPTLNGAPNAPFHRVIGTPEEAAAAVADLVVAGVDLLKTHNATGRETYFALLEAATAAGLEVVGHVPTEVSPLEACEAGQASIEHIATLFEGTYIARFDGELEAFLAMPEWLAEEAEALIECFARQGTYFSPTLRAYEIRARRAEEYDDPNPAWRYVDAELHQRWRDQGPPNEMDRNPQVIELRGSLVRSGQELVRRLVEAGAPVVASTDLGVGVLPGFDLHREVELFVEAGLTPQQALRAATRGPGEGAGADPLTGRLVAGAPADLLLLRDNPLEDVGALSSIDAVVLRGRLLDRVELDRRLADLAAAGPTDLAAPPAN